ncbi:MAG: glycosyl hydrolase [Symploca sp. SIO2E9]|nr:glycosyl hydrolase [Symploca sp. SIO2E9]
MVLRLTTLVIAPPVLVNTAAIAVLFALAGCVSMTPQSETSLDSSPKTEDSSVASSSSVAKLQVNSELLQQSWLVYRQQFIQTDGRVIDYEASDRSTSEGQAYAMLRAVLINDPITFEATLNWAQNNLTRRSAAGEPIDQLWAWKWGIDQAGNWGIIDENFASDADIDCITALILASRRWGRPEYLDLALTKLRDLWQFSTIEGPGGKNYLLPGPASAFVFPEGSIHLNPSYFAPYAFRLFAQVDPDHDWLSLVESSYQVLTNSSLVSATGLPSDWIALNLKTGQFEPLPSDSKIESVYSFDAYRVWWRLAWDVAWFDSREARSYLQTASQHLQQLWHSSSRLPARIDLKGQATVSYDATSQYAMLYAAWRLIEPETAQQLLEKKLLPRYNQGIWDDQSAYYTQNLVWLALLPPTDIEPQLLQPQ